MIMTPTHTDTPLRRSDAASLRSPVEAPVINDDDEERREARRRTLLSDNSVGTLEDNETLKSCLKIYNENKLSKENVWSSSLIDTLSSLLDKHHKQLNNFKVAGCSLEASSKIYGLRVDSIHTDVVRLSSGLNKQKITNTLNDNNDDNGESGVNYNKETNENISPISRPKQRVRKTVSTITKNKETNNARLDTNPITDPIFAKLGAISGSINSSNRLLQNILCSVDSELRLRMNYKFWDSERKEPLQYAEEYVYSECHFVEGKILDSLNLDFLVLRTHHTGYIISDTPAEQDDDDNNGPTSDSIDDEDISQMAVAFDINAEVEPIPSNIDPYVDIDMGDLEDFTSEERIAIQNCKGLRRAPVLIEDMRPIDATSSTLEYSYRALDKISQFWAGPSHWKFRKSRTKSFGSTLNTILHEQQRHRNQRCRRKPKLSIKHIQFGHVNDKLFLNIDSKSKFRKMNVQKKFDAKKLKLPSDLQIDRNIYDTFRYAPGIPVEVEESISPDLPLESNYCYSNVTDEGHCSDIQNEEIITSAGDGQTEVENENQTIVEIASDFAGAPEKVTKIIVPFAKRAKVIDMKQLKKCCLHLIIRQMKVINNETSENLEQFNDERYKNGSACFSKVYQDLPNILTSNMAESLSRSVAFYSILHLANEKNLRLLPQNDLKDFHIKLLE